MQVAPSSAVVLDPSWAFRQERSTPCEQLLNLALDINVNVFDDYPTVVQTAILLTQMPTTVSVSDVTLISSVFLSDIQMQTSEQAYLCETEPDGTCKRLQAMASSWNTDPLALLSDKTKETFAGKYSNESVETVVIPFLKKISQRFHLLLKNNCELVGKEKVTEPVRTNTEEWTPMTYPNPRTNRTACNTWENSTLCDPDHILTDQWRSDIDNTIKSIENQLEEAGVQYTENAHESCGINASEPVRLYVVLAKRIKSETNESVSDSDLTTFGDELMQLYGLSSQECKNYLIIIGVQTYKAYVRTGKDLKLPGDMMERIFSQVTNLFNSRNYMEVLSKIIEETGREMLLAFKKEESTNELIKDLSQATDQPQTDTPETNLSTLDEEQATTWYKRQKPVETQTVVSINNNEFPPSPESEKRSYSEKTENSDDECSLHDDDNPYIVVTEKIFSQAVVDETGSSTTSKCKINENTTASAIDKHADVEKAAKAEIIERDQIDEKETNRVKISRLDLSTDFIKNLSPFKVFHHDDKRLTSKL
ncbi:hypothetical protein QR680_001768 [Steinernema hermaphroditum]|uniref:Uncharacterized protein n=1 Tax=Steinernema hermaphroditum TaxID=289476 RepID=A0AA39GZS5_9BILA|nr:hypothetical protein QR680_001768 [Steinernema hermaphroditum]